MITTLPEIRTISSIYVPIKARIVAVRKMTDLEKVFTISLRMGCQSITHRVSSWQYLCWGLEKHPSVSLLRRAAAKKILICAFGGLVM